MDTDGIFSSSRRVGWSVFPVDWYNHRDYNISKSREKGIRKSYILDVNDCYNNTATTREMSNLFAEAFMCW